MTPKPHADADVPLRGVARLLHRIGWQTLDRPALVTLRLALFYGVLLFAVPWLILKGPAVMSPSVVAFAQAAEDGRATLHAAAIKAQPAMGLRTHGSGGTK
ncbi:MAG: hypothetical protein WCB48_08305 [Casimicrobiaceae bacterium]